MSYASQMKGKWGLFTHFIDLVVNNPEKANSLGVRTSWEECVDGVDVDRLAAEIASTGASWFGLTMHQQTACICAPNETFECLTGIPRGEATTHRDLPMELGLALRKYGVDLMLYHTAEGPVLDQKAGDALGGIEKGKPLSETYFRNWLEVLREDARRYASLVKYWWIDGCYPHLGYTPDRLQTVSDVFHAENPDYAVALNYYGCARKFYEPYPDGVYRADWFLDPAYAVVGEDYAAGETNVLAGLPDHWSDPGTGSHVLPQNKDAQWHLLAFLGKPSNPRAVYDGWGSPGCKYDAGWLSCYRREVMNRGGALTLDCCVRRDGSIDPDQLAMLRAIAE